MVVVRCALEVGGDGMELRKLGQKLRGTLAVVYAEGIEEWLVGAAARRWQATARLLSA
jgi:hypothetical protein